MLKNKIVFFSMGGTIISTQTPGGLKPTQDARLIIEKILSKEKLQNIKFIEHLKVDSADLNLQDLLLLNKSLAEIKTDPNIQSVVVLMGTDNLEHAAFFLSLLSPIESQMIVLTGAMISYGQPHSDALTNIKDAYQTATMPFEKKNPVLIVFNGKIYDAFWVRKSTTDTHDAFTKTRKPADPFQAQQIIENKDFFIKSKPLFFPKIRTLKVSPGEDMTAISDAVAAGSQVIILEGLGKGNVNSETIVEVQKNIGKTIFIVTTQVLHGVAEPIYQSAIQLKELGAIFAGNLSSGKVLILSSLFLTQPEIKNLEMTQKKKKLEEIFTRLSQ